MTLGTLKWGEEVSPFGVHEAAWVTSPTHVLSSGGFWKLNLHKPFQQNPRKMLLYNCELYEVFKKYILRSGALRVNQYTCIVW